MSSGPKRSSDVRSRTDRVLLAAAAAWCLAIVAAPALHLTFIYNFFAVICHQQPARSWQVAGEPLAVCIRCTSIYFGFLAALAADLPANARMLRIALAANAVQFLFALFVVDSVAFRAASGLALGASAAPFVRIGLNQLFSGAARNAV
jgi:hypothetical protein